MKAFVYLGVCQSVSESIRMFLTSNSKNTNFDRSQYQKALCPLYAEKASYDALLLRFITHIL